MKLSSKDAVTIAGMLADVAQREVMPRFRKVRELEVREKTSSFDVVTDADLAAERAISESLSRLFPGAAIIGEEKAARDATVLEGLASAELAFIVDPIDGTKNFVSGLPLFGIMVAATIRGEIALAAIHDPVCGDTALAVRGEGAWLEGDGPTRIELRVASAVPVPEMNAIIGTNFLPEPLRTTVNGNLSRLGMSSWLRCAAHEYRMVAAGHCHLLFYNKLMPWDHAAGWLLHREAGGYSAHFDGSAYRPDHLTGGLICAPDKESWERARQALFQPRSTE
ncbi:MULTISPECIES: inositol monophosphatase [Paraburkholderia]|uniref:inositol monophosphatase family protein n=1 Tax=Paraburkholderia TaxID=1822464 RepID=UPI002250FF1F|nr:MULTISPECIES: inositol monophosphatase [Paraburkholderia]MCX4162576.1 inositol monophosphatase [Paraburkholderia megapolitana]MDN7158071.1 inositol monophosphatase [Paraburkholderia sp. CHISQ3]MDQ6495118.1 inositol monophosphatase [Paraburkholderia megapolitana]